MILFPGSFHFIGSMSYAAGRLLSHEGQHRGKGPYKTFPPYYKGSGGDVFLYTADGALPTICSSMKFFPQSPSHAGSAGISRCFSGDMRHRVAPAKRSVPRQGKKLLRFVHAVFHQKTLSLKGTIHSLFVRSIPSSAPIPRQQAVPD